MKITSFITSTLRIIGLSLSFIGLSAATHTSPIEVYSGGNLESIGRQFSKSKQAFVFFAQPAKDFETAKVAKHAMLMTSDLPRDLKMDQTEHTVNVGMIVSDKGKVVATAVVSSNSKDLEDPAIEMAQKFKFSAARLGGKPVYSYLVLPVSYRYEPFVWPGK